MNVRVAIGSSQTRPWQSIGADWLVVGVPDSAEMTGLLQELDQALSGRLARLRDNGDLSGKHAELLTIHDPSPLAAKRLLLVGLGKPKELNLSRCDKACMTAFRRVCEKKCPLAAMMIPEFEGSAISPRDIVQTIAAAATVSGVGQGIYKAEPGRFPIDELEIVFGRSTSLSQAEADAAAHRGQVLGEAINVVRELVNRPAADLYPESFAQRARELSEDFGLSCGVFDESRLKQERMGSMLAVAQGSDRPPRMVVLEYDGGKEDGPRLALVGKGVTFDSGGLSLKPTDGMLTMKCDMAGAATVLGTLIACARLKLPVNVTGYLGLVENMVSGHSYKLGDVLTARSGTTIEVNNTDAEGRLVLADVLRYAVDDGADKLIDLATLTGSCVVALGDDVTGVFTNNQPWCDEFLAAAKRSGEDVWQLPMFDHYSELLKSDVADVKNTGGRPGGAITAAKFLEKFVDEKPWVHLDIAGPAFASASKPHREGGGTGCMVRTLVELASRFAG
jgi:leucyl aminopeptidase